MYSNIILNLKKKKFVLEKKVNKYKHIVCKMEVGEKKCCISSNYPIS